MFAIAIGASLIVVVLVAVVAGAFLVIAGSRTPKASQLGNDAGDDWEAPEGYGDPLASVDGTGGFREQIVGVANDGLEKYGDRKTLRVKLENAGSNFKPAEWVVVVGMSMVVGLMVGFVVFGLIGMVLFPILAFLLCRQVIKFKTKRRQKAFANQMLETLQILAGGMRSGLSLPQAIDSVASESDSPTQEEFTRVITESRLGRDLSEGLRDMSARMGSKDFGWIVSAIDTHREVGGDLASILDRAGTTIRARNRVRGQVAALSAEGKLSGVILLGLPPVMFLAMGVLNPEYMGLLTSRKAGYAILGVGVTLETLGALWIRKIARFVY